IELSERFEFHRPVKLFIAPIDDIGWCQRHESDLQGRCPIALSIARRGECTREGWRIISRVPHGIANWNSVNLAQRTRAYVLYQVANLLQRFQARCRIRAANAIAAVDSDVDQVPV